ncbi:MAG: DUF4331 family protein [Myxococcales bacterium]|nr:DUF4331 family protein [Myxococcales bacterium]
MTHPKIGASARRGLAGLAVLSLALVLHGSDTARAADHRDAPLVLGNPTTDIDDLYAFVPAGSGDLVIAATFGNFVADPGNAALFDSGAVYDIYIDRDGDRIPEMTIRTRFNAGTPQVFSTTGIIGGPIVGTVADFGNSNASATVPTAFGDVRVYAGARDDPFFFDSVGFNAFRTQLYLPDNGLRNTAINGAPQNAFAGLNVAAIVYQIPIEIVMGDRNAVGGNVAIWGKTFEPIFRILQENQ